MHDKYKDVAIWKYFGILTNVKAYEATRKSEFLKIFYVNYMNKNLILIRLARIYDLWNLWKSQLNWW